MSRIRRYSILPLILLFVALGHADVWAQASQGTIVVRVIAFRSSQGNLHLSLYNKEQNFPDLDMRLETKLQPVTNSSVVEVKFENVPYGNYAIAGLHDENRSGDMDYNWIGMPKEGFCFSNDAKPVVAPPSFHEAKFKLDKPSKVVYVAMQY